jgi:hypothetical protein
VARSPPMLVITPKVRVPWYVQLTRSPRFTFYPLALALALRTRAFGACSSLKA